MVAHSEVGPDLLGSLGLEKRACEDSAHLKMLAAV